MQVLRSDVEPVLMSLSRPSDVSPTTGSDHDAPDGPGRRTKSATSASRTTPTLCVLVIAIGVVSIPDSRIHSSPVISPLPLSRWQPANTGSWASPGPRGMTTVTPVRTGPRPVTSGPSPSSSVVNPTRTPATSVIALNGPGRPAPDRDPEVARPHPGMLAGSATRAARPPRVRHRRPERRRAHRRRRAYHRPVIPTPRPSAPLRMRRLPDRSPRRARSMLPRRSATCPASSCWRAPGRAATRAGPISPPIRWPSSSRRRPDPTPSPSLAGWSPGSTRRRSSRPTSRRSSAAWSASSATTSARSSSGCPRARRSTRTCRRSGWRSMTGSSPGIGGPATPGSAAGRSMATGVAWPAGSTTSMPG